MTAFLPTAQSLSSNPLDMAEQVLSEREWCYDRAENEELLADYEGAWGNYRLAINWHEAFGALTLSCVLDCKIPTALASKLYPLLAKINEKLWLGHFDLSEEEGGIAFRYAMLLKGRSNISLEQVEELLDIAVGECERFYPAFQSVLWGDKTADDVLHLALLEPQGEA